MESSIYLPGGLSNDTTPRHLSLGHAPPIANGIHLISPRDYLSDRFRVIFPFELFNAVQSKSFAAVFESNDNVIISAPTGSGKTAILELAICRLLSVKTNQNFKVVYQAPTKSLCSERARDWEKKFRHLNLECAELTGDTSAAEMARVRAAQIIVTTPEKWDSITRKWADHRKLLELVELVLIDEVHILKDVRGATLEAVVSRMKTIGANVRFVALSATVPNSGDVAQWLGRDHTNPQLPARRETFGENMRPVKLQKHVYGEHCSGNDYQLEKQLDSKLLTVIARHTQRKPILVFCYTRKSCETTAAKLGQMWSCATSDDKPWPGPRHKVNVLNQALQEVSRSGVAFHHAGLEHQDRLAVEKAYLDGELHVICCTSTLAVGVNLPCHTVVLKGTVGYQDGKLVEYCDLEVMQMLGRAGRPQFDDSAVAIILTRAENKARYEDMASGKQVLESTLHLNLIEHLNSEIGLRTVDSLWSAKAWLNGTFLAVRLRRNPSHYQLNSESYNCREDLSPDEKLERICERDIKLLQEADLVTRADMLECTAAGIAMSKYMVRFETMKLILAIPRGSSLFDILNTLAKAVEFNDLRMKANERALYRALNDSPFMLRRFKESSLGDTWHKVSILVQIETAGGDVQAAVGKKDNASGGARNQYNTDKRLVFDRIRRLIRCAIDCKGSEGDSESVRSALELLRSVTAGGWEKLPSQLLQVPGIGPVYMRKLTLHGISSMEALGRADYMTIENFLTRKPPFGKNLMDTVRRFPKLGLEIELVELPGRRPSSSSPRNQVNVKAVLKYDCPSTGPPGKKVVFLTLMAETADKRLAYFWRGSARKVAKDGGLELNFSATMSGRDDFVTCHFDCEELVGLGVSRSLHHSLPEAAFVEEKPTRKDRSPSPISSRRRPCEKGDGGFDFDDDDVIEVLEEISSSTRPNGSLDDFEDDVFEDDVFDDDDDDDDEFPPIEAILGPAQVQSATAQTRVVPLPHEQELRLPNGRWRCNHACGEAGLTRTGKPCKHACCHDGLEKKPSKVKAKPKPKAAAVVAVTGVRSKRALDESAAASPPDSPAPLAKKRVALVGDAEPSWTRDFDGDLMEYLRVGNIDFV